MFSTEGIDDIFRLSLHRAFALAYFGPRCTQVIILSHAKRIGKSAIGQSHAIDLCTFSKFVRLTRVLQMFSALYTEVPGFSSTASCTVLDFANVSNGFCKKKYFIKRKYFVVFTF